LYKWAKTDVLFAEVIRKIFFMTFQCKLLIVDKQLNQYQIVLVNLDPTVGSEIKKTRPCVIISPDEMNKYLQTVIIAPMTSQSKPYPTRIEVKHNNKKGWLVLDQLRTIDKQRIIKVYEKLTGKEITKLKLIMKETFVD